MDIIKYNRKVGYYVESTDLAKQLSTTHQNLMKRVNRLNSNRYIHYHTIKDKYCKNGNKISYMLRIKHLQLLDRQDLVEEMLIRSKKMQEEIAEHLKVMFGR